MLSIFQLITTVHKLIVHVSGMSYGSLVVLAAVGGEVTRVVAEVAHVAEGVASDREAGARWLVAYAFILIVTDVDEGQPLGALGCGLLVGLQRSFQRSFFHEGRLGSSGKEGAPRVLQLSCA